MTDSKLINLLKTLSEDEFKQLEKFIGSPFYNKGRDLLPFFKSIKSFYPDFNDKYLSNEFIFGKLFPCKKYNGIRSDNLIRTLSSHLFRISKDFLIHLELEEQTSKKKYFLLNQLRKRKLYKEFDKEYSEISKNFDDSGKGSVGFFIDRYFLTAVHRDCSLNRDDFSSSFEFSLQTGENIAAAALISAFKFEDEKNLAAAYGIPVRDNLLDLILKNLDPINFMSGVNTDHEHFPYLQIFQGIYMMNSHKENTTYYFNLKKLLKKHSSYFGQPENYVLWNTMLTYCGVNKLGSKEAFELQKYMLENGVYKPMNSENFHIVLFRNIVLDSSFIGEYQWLEKFIEKYSAELHEHHRDNMKIFSMAYLSFSRNDFGKSLEYILRIKYNLFLFKLDVKILQLKIYYELGYIEEGLSLVSATLNYLSNTKEVSSLGKEAIGTFAKCVRDLIRIKSEGIVKDEDLYKLKITAEKISYKGLADWLTEKVGQLKRA
ncbi:MAG TPA: hypothetical protein PK536_02600 [Ignavibacteria bacterium]|nr:hypothetical protein [Bacteroidota bacterium]HRI84318.1 hypothetical protein [Ignavibacteria bacterium]HRJ99378.1 hypothetical protein [Ignavibacteria bacterium]